MHRVVCCFFQAYDDSVREEGVQKGDKKQVFKYSAESELSTSLMDDLKTRVTANKDKVTCILHVAKNTEQEC